MPETAIVQFPFFPDLLARDHVVRVAVLQEGTVDVEILEDVFPVRHPLLSRVGEEATSGGPVPDVEEAAL